MDTEKPKRFAISEADYAKHGCPYCSGPNARFMPKTADGKEQLAQCETCSQPCVVLASGVTRSTIRLHGKDLELEPHPAKSKPVPRRDLVTSILSMFGSD